MVNVVTLPQLILRTILKLLAGITSQKLEIEPGTTMNFWVPTRTKKQNRPVLVLVHGFCGDGLLNWFFQMLTLSKDYAVYVPDVLFFGDSVTERPERSSTFQAECLGKGLRLLGVERCTLVGLSYGGMIGFKLAKLQPDLVETLVVSSCVMELTESISTASARRIGFSSWSHILLPETVEGVKLELSIGSHKFPWMPDLFLQALPTGKDGAETHSDHFFHALLACCPQVMYSNRKERAELLDALVCRDEDAMSPCFSQRIELLWGENDKIFSLEEANNIKKRLGDNARLHCVEKAGHILQLEKPCIYSSCLKKILASNN